MTDFRAKARRGRIIALQLHQANTVIFFPEEPEHDVTPIRRTVSAMSKPMFVRSSTLTTDMIARAPEPETVANGPLVLTEAQLVAEVLKKAA